MAFVGLLCFASFLLLAGVQHFVWAQFVAQLVPSWIPGSAFWTYFSAAALIAGALGLLVPQTRRMAACWTGAMIFAWVWLLHVPRASRDLSDTNELVAVFEALAFSGTAWLFLRQPARSERSERSVGEQ